MLFLSVSPFLESCFLGGLFSVEGGNFRSYSVQQLCVKLVVQEGIHLKNVAGKHFPVSSYSLFQKLQLGLPPLEYPAESRKRIRGYFTIIREIVQQKNVPRSRRIRPRSGLKSASRSGRVRPTSELINAPAIMARPGLNMRPAYRSGIASRFSTRSTAFAAIRAPSPPALPRLSYPPP